MYITEQSPTQLKLNRKVAFPLLYAILGILSSTLFIGIGGSLLIYRARITTLKCDRVEPTQAACEISVYSLLGKHTTEMPTVQLQGAEVAVSSDADGTVQLQGAEVYVGSDADGDDIYSITLNTQAGNISLTPYSQRFGVNAMYRNVDQINHFLANSGQESLQIWQNDVWFYALFGGVFILVGGILLWLFFKKQVQIECIFDKKLEQMCLTQRNVFASETWRKMLKEIQIVEMIEETDSDGDSVYVTYLKLKTGDKIPLEIAGSSGEQQNVAQTINHFLNNSLEER
ncbi:MAG: hypothetical protein HC835_03150 [Oscillatoriales cyanobacterium RM2_1_1]|nr:hypothetical protein [Oscillatoriales cyanobacterium RM2_1_1]